MQSFFLSVFNTIFPQRCLGCGQLGAEFCSSCLARLTCQVKNFYKNKFQLIALAEYQNRSIAKLIKAWKYSHRSSLLTILLRNIDQVNLSRYDYLVAVPMHKRRSIERGGNHIDQILLKIAPEKQLLGFIRCKKTKQQAKLSKKERQSNLEGAFAYQGTSLCEKRILVVDDVVSTGETIKACRAVLLAAGAKEVDVLCLAINQQKNSKQAV